MTLRKPARPTLHPERLTPRRGSGFVTRVARGTRQIEGAEIEKRDTIPAPPPPFDDLEPPTLRSRR